MPGNTKDAPSRQPSRFALALAGFTAVAGILLVLEHRAHVLPYLPWLLLLACPLLHVFMHGRHGPPRNVPSGAADARPGQQQDPGGSSEARRGDRP